MLPRIGHDRTLLRAACHYAHGFANAVEQRLCVRSMTQLVLFTIDFQLSRALRPSERWGGEWKMDLR